MNHTEQNDFEKWLQRKTEQIGEPEVSSEFLAAQRRSIYRRVGEPHRGWKPMRWAFSLAMLLLMLAGGLTLERRHESPAGISDEQLFSDLTVMEQHNEPKAIQPMHGLFEE